VIATIQMRRKIRLVLPDQNPGHTRRQSTEHLSAGVDDKPILADRERFSLASPWHVCSHIRSYTFPRKDNP